MLIGEGEVLDGRWKETKRTARESTHAKINGTENLCGD